MADQKAQCGSVPITYPSECTYVCYCVPNGGCHWSVTCGDWTTGGKGLTATSDPHPNHVTVRGDLAIAAKILAKGWKRSVKVPTNLRGKVISRKRDIEGTPEEIAKALGLVLGPRR
jgi:hypothetical protein